MSQFQENLPTDERTGRQTVRQILFYRTHPAEARGPKSPLVFLLTQVKNVKYLVMTIYGALN